MDIDTFRQIIRQYNTNKNKTANDGTYSQSEHFTYDVILRIYEEIYSRECATEIKLSALHPGDTPDYDIISEKYDELQEVREFIETLVLDIEDESVLSPNVDFLNSWKIHEQERACK